MFYYSSCSKYSDKAAAIKAKPLTAEPPSQIPRPHRTTSPTTSQKIQEPFPFLSPYFGPLNSRPYFSPFPYHLGPILAHLNQSPHWASHQTPTVGFLMYLSHAVSSFYRLWPWIYCCKQFFPQEFFLCPKKWNFCRLFPGSY